MCAAVIRSTILARETLRVSRCIPFGCGTSCQKRVAASPLAGLGDMPLHLQPNHTQTGGCLIAIQGMSLP